MRIIGDRGREVGKICSWLVAGKGGMRVGKLPWSGMMVNVGVLSECGESGIKKAARKRRSPL